MLPLSNDKYQGTNNYRQQLRPDSWYSFSYMLPLLDLLRQLAIYFAKINSSSSPLSSVILLEGQRGLWALRSPPKINAKVFLTFSIGYRHKEGFS